VFKLRLFVNANPIQKPRMPSTAESTNMKATKRSDIPEYAAMCREVCKTKKFKIRHTFNDKHK